MSAKILFEKPFALSMGPQRSGVDGLYSYFKAREDVCLPADVKEIFYFDRHFQRGRDFYVSHFKVQDHHKLVIELSTTAFDNPQAPERVRELCGKDLKLLCPLRHPVERAIAVYKDLLKYGIVKGSVEEAVRHAPQILHASRYAEHLERWYTQFGAGSVHIVFYEDMLVAPADFMNGICAYLDLPQIQNFENLEKGERPASGLARIKTWFQTGETSQNDNVSIQPDDLKYLQDRLGLEIEKTRNLTGLSIACWNL